MRATNRLKTLLGTAVAALAGVLTGCSGSTEDVRVSLCKNLASALNPGAAAIEWTGGENRFYRPEYAVTGLTFEVTDSGGKKTPMTAECHFEYEALDDTAITLSQPLSAYASLPFAMVYNGRRFGGRELLDLVNAEQRRLGRAAVDTLERGARQAADKLRSGPGQ